MREDSENTAEGGEEEKDPALERAFEEMAVPPWQKQITVRAMVASFLLSVVFNIIVCKLNLSTGIIPSLNVAAGLLGFAAVKAYTFALGKCGLLKQPFTRQENTVIQTCVVASSGIAFSSGTASYLLGMTPLVAAQGEMGNTPLNIKSLSLGWMMGFLFLVSFVGLFSILPLRRVMILKYKLTYPSGTATAYLINSFHTPKGAKLAARQVWVLFKAFVVSFLWGCFQWFFAAADGCGFSNFPTFGLKAFSQRFYFDFSATYVGVGMICPYMVNVSLLIGAIISWGIMWPAIASKKGIWFSADEPASSLHGIQGYRVFLAIATILGDGLFQVAYMVVLSVYSFIQQQRHKAENSRTDGGDGSGAAATTADYDESRRVEYFLKDQIPIPVAIAGYVIVALISTFSVPAIFPQLKWYQIIVCYLIGPILAFCNAYGCGLSDWSLASNYGKIAIIVFSSWVGLGGGGVIAGLAACGVMMSVVSTASDLMQDFKTGYLTLSSPRSMFVSQVLGTAMGCIITPLVFWFFYKAYPLGDPHGPYPAPFASLYRGIAILGVEGFSALPKNCLKLAVVCFAAAVAINVVRLALKEWETKYRVYRFVPSPMCMAIPFYLGGYFAIDMCVGSLILAVWSWRNEKSAKELAPAVASGMICGDSLWGVPAAVLALAGAKAPVCMRFLSLAENARVDTLLGG